MIDLYTLLIVALLLVTHYIADFRLQSNWMALNKSRWKEIWTCQGDNCNCMSQSNPFKSPCTEGVRALGSHVLVYSACFIWMGLGFVILTGLLHLVTDAITSRLTSRYWFVLPDAMWEPKYDPLKRKLFWRVIGFDQLIHGLSLLATLYLTRG